jgi:hypothetical protein
MDHAQAPNIPLPGGGRGATKPVVPSMCCPSPLYSPHFSRLRSAGVPPAVVAASRAATWAGGGAWHGARGSVLPSAGRRDAARTAGGDAGAPKSSCSCCRSIFAMSLLLDLSAREKCGIRGARRQVGSELSFLVCCEERRSAPSVTRAGHRRPGRGRIPVRESAARGTGTWGGVLSGAAWLQPAVAGQTRRVVRQTRERDGEHAEDDGERSDTGGEDSASGGGDWRGCRGTPGERRGTLATLPGQARGFAREGSGTGGEDFELSRADSPVSPGYRGDCPIRLTRLPDEVRSFTEDTWLLIRQAKMHFLLTTRPTGTTLWTTRRQRLSNDVRFLRVVDGGMYKAGRG